MNPRRSWSVATTCVVAPAAVLLVEDDPDVREVLRQALVDAGHDVQTASTRADAARYLLTRRVDLLVADLILVDGDGAALMRLAERHGIAVLGITGHPTWPRDIPGAVKLPRSAFLKKPFPVARLMQEAERLLASAG